jgi:hypothetical protein
VLPCRGQVISTSEGASGASGGLRRRSGRAICQRRSQCRTVATERSSASAISRRLAPSRASRSRTSRSGAPRAATWRRRVVAARAFAPSTPPWTRDVRSLGRFARGTCLFELSCQPLAVHERKFASVTDGSVRRAASAAIPYGSRAVARRPSATEASSRTKPPAANAAVTSRRSSLVATREPSCS